MQENEKKLAEHVALLSALRSSTRGLTAVVKRRNPDGSWTNQNSRWMEDDPDLVTGFSLMTMSYLRPEK